MKSLILVESPRLAKSIQRLLEDNYIVKSCHDYIKASFNYMDQKSVGDFKRHITINFEHRKKFIESLKHDIEKVNNNIWLALDCDIYGETMCLHIALLLGINPKNKNRIIFHELTKEDIQLSLTKPRAIDMNKVINPGYFRSFRYKEYMFQNKNEWNILNFLITPYELTSLFTNLELIFVQTDEEVIKEYTHTDPESLFLAYKILFNHVLISNNPILKLREISLIADKTHISITDDMEKIVFEEIQNYKGVISSQFNFIRSLEPVIYLRPFSLLIKNKKMTLTDYVSTKDIIGLRLSFPKFVSFSKNNYTKVEDTNLCSNKVLYDTLSNRIKEITERANFKIQEKKYKTNIWISPASKKIINKNRILTEKNIVIIE